MSTSDSTNLTSAQTVDAMLSARRRSWMAEADHFLLAAHFADLHSTVDDEPGEAGRPVCLHGERLLQLGDDGTPLVAEFAPLELSAALDVTRESAERLIGDALSLRHRMPGLWEKVEQGFLRVVVARSIIAIAQRLPLAQARVLDRDLTPLVGGVTNHRLITICEARVLELTPESEAQSAHEAALASRGVWLDPSRDGVTHVEAQLLASDAIFLDAQLNRIASILRQGGRSESSDVLRASGLGMLASPAQALQFLQASLLDEADDPHLPLADTDEPDDLVGAGCPAAGQRGHTCGTIMVDPELLLPPASVVVHLEENTLAELDGMARVERCGPVLAQWLGELLGHTRVTLKPVIDPSGITPSDRYEISHRMRQVVYARNPIEVFPGSKKLAQACDLDHTIVWRPPDGVAAEDRMLTRPENLGPLSRRVHRAKTFGGFQLRQLAPGVFFWRTPDGFCYLTTPARSWMVHNPVRGHDLAVT
ncbi:DUF222 domain-containing protein [Luteococcus sp. H138]|uniref:DUF222 domain-containing protein n=1 Tax=unclassified Luteococcus TaxID=2639923 RepID=UPI00313B4B50